MEGTHACDLAMGRKNPIAIVQCIKIAAMWYDRRFASGRSTQGAMQMASTQTTQKPAAVNLIHFAISK